MKKVSYKGYVRVKRRLIVAEPSADGGGYSWTLAAALGEMLLHAEEMFGPRDLSYTLLGIDFSPGGGQTWTPGDCRHIIVHLDMNCLIDRYDAYNQLAHECIHLISPTGKADANVLEEGLAVYFQQWYVNSVFGKGWWSEDPVNAPSYHAALISARELLALDPDIIKKIRQHQPTIAHITAEQIQEHCPATSQEMALALTARFKDADLVRDVEDTQTEGRPAFVTSGGLSASTKK